MRQEAVRERQAIHEFLRFNEHRNHPIPSWEIREETECDIPALSAALKWLEKEGLIEQHGKRGWTYKEMFPVAFCWIHGRISGGTIDCPKCARRRPRIQTSEATREVPEASISGSGNTRLRAAQW